MSYDIYFLQADDSADPAGFLERLEQGSRSSTPGSDARQHAVVDALRRIDPLLVPFSFDYDEIAKCLGITVEDARRAHSHVELNGPVENGVQIMVHGNHVAIAVAYWHAFSEAERVFSLVERYASEISTAGRYRVYDPQLERVVDRFGEVRAAALNAYSGLVAQVPNLTRSEKTQMKPWWKFW